MPHGVPVGRGASARAEGAVPLATRRGAALLPLLVSMAMGHAACDHGVRLLGELDTTGPDGTTGADADAGPDGTPDTDASPPTASSSPARLP